MKTNPRQWGREVEDRFRKMLDGWAGDGSIIEWTDNHNALVEATWVDGSKFTGYRPLYCDDIETSPEHCGTMSLPDFRLIYPGYGRDIWVELKAVRGRRVHVPGYEFVQVRQHVIDPLTAHGATFLIVTRDDGILYARVANPIDLMPIVDEYGSPPLIYKNKFVVDLPPISCELDDPDLAEILAVEATKYRWQARVKHRLYAEA